MGGHTQVMARQLEAPNGNHVRFEALYEAHRLHVLAYCVRRTSPSDASDACSETFLIAWRRLDDVPHSPSALPFLYGIAGKVLANQRRSVRRRSRLDRKLKGLGIAIVPDASVQVVRDSQDAEVAAAVRKLKPKDREIVMLYAWEDLPRGMIADMMGMTKAAVDQRIHRAYKRLARTLEPERAKFNQISPPVAEKGGA